MSGSGLAGNGTGVGTGGGSMTGLKGLPSADYNQYLLQLKKLATNRSFARGERPVTNYGMEVGNLIGDEIVRVLTGELGAAEAMANAERTVAALGPPW